MCPPIPWEHFRKLCVRDSFNDSESTCTYFVKWYGEYSKLLWIRKNWERSDSTSLQTKDTKTVNRTFMYICTGVYYTHIWSIFHLARQDYFYFVPQHHNNFLISFPNNIYMYIIHIVWLCAHFLLEKWRKYVTVFIWSTTYLGYSTPSLTPFSELQLVFSVHCRKAVHPL